MAIPKAGDTSRIYTLISKIRAKFRFNRDNEIIGVQVSKEDINRAVSPDNIIVGEGVKKIIVSATPPVSPDDGDIWIDIS